MRNPSRLQAQQAPGSWWASRCWPTASEMLSRMTVDSAAIEQHVDEVDAQLLEQHKQRNIILPQIWHSMVTAKANVHERAGARFWDRQGRHTVWTQWGVLLHPRLYFPRKYFPRYYVPSVGASTEKKNRRKSHRRKSKGPSWAPSFKRARLQRTPPQHTRSQCGGPAWPGEKALAF